MNSFKNIAEFPHTFSADEHQKACLFYLLSYLKAPHFHKIWEQYYYKLPSMKK